METNSQLIKKIKEGGYNNVYPIAYIDGIIDKESNEKLSDILIRYNNIMVPWQGDVASTRNRVPSLMRRQGIVITYITDLSEIVTEVYKGTVEDIKNNWADNINWELVPDLKFVQDNASKLPDGTITPEKLSPALQELISQSGSVVNMPDDEDLEQKDMVLKFKDRPYNSELANGKGYKILRKNWTNVGTKTINLLTQDAFNQSNTIYELRYDFDLNGEEITIPEGCVLDFQGGSLNNGRIIGNNTTIKAELIKIFGLDINFSGNWSVSEVYPEWFGVSGDGINDDRDAMQQAIDFGILSHGIVHISKPKNYYLLNSYKISDRGIKYCLKISQGVIIEGELYKKELTGNGLMDFYIGHFEDKEIDTILLLEGEFQGFEYRLPDVILKNISFAGFDKTDIDLPDSNKVSNGIYTPNDDSLVHSILENVCVLGCREAGFNISGFMCTLNKCSAWFNKNGFIIRGRSDGTNCTSITLTNCEVMNSPNVTSQYGYSIQGMTYCNLITCACDGMNIAYNIYNSYGINLIGCGTEKCKKLIDANTWCQSTIDGFTAVLLPNYNYDNLFDLKASFGNTFNGLGVIGVRPTTIINFDKDCVNNTITDWQLKHSEINISLPEEVSEKSNIAYRLNGSYFDRQNLFGEQGNRLSEGMRYLSSRKKSKVYLGNDLWTNIIQSSEFSKIQTYKIIITDTGELATMTGNVFSFRTNGTDLPLNPTIINASQSTYNGLIIGKITLSSLTGGYINLINLSSSPIDISNLEITLVVGDNNTGI